MQETTAFIVYIQIFAVLEKLLKVSGIADASKIDISTIFLSELKKLGLNPNERKAVEIFYRKPVGILNISFQPSEILLKNALELMYKRLCKSIGPVEADKIFGNTIIKVSTSKAAQVYPPKKFL